MADHALPVRHVAVIDVGKSNAKVALVDRLQGTELQVLQQSNGVLNTPPYPHADLDSLWQFVLRSLRELQATMPIDALSVTTHGASIVLLDEAGELALPMLDYEHDGPDELEADYDQVRPAFEQSGSPRLPGGLNVGAQLYWQAHRFPAAWARVRYLLMYPQYWAWRLSGVMANEASSLGAHTDLWAPAAGDFSDLVREQGWIDRMAPLRSAFDRLGPVLPDVAQATGLNSNIPVHVGLHDSNASLLPYLIGEPGPFTVVSTGTWVIVMGIQAKVVTLDASRDTLINVNALGEPVPSARFMGGREFEYVMQGQEFAFDEAALVRVLSESIMLLPAVVPGCGPFTGRTMAWSHPEGSLSTTERSMVLSMYLALMTHTCLGLIGAQVPVIVEGAFVQNRAYTGALALLVDGPVRVAAGGVTGTSVGAALLAATADTASGKAGNRTADKSADTAWPKTKPAPEFDHPSISALLAAYARAWQAAAER